MRSASVGGKLKLNATPVFFLAAKVDKFLNLPNRFSWAVVHRPQFKILCMK